MGMGRRGGRVVMGKGGGGGAVRCGWGVAGPDRTVIMVKHRILCAKRLVTELSSPTRNARLVHVEIVDGRPFKDVGLGVAGWPDGAGRGEAGRGRPTEGSGFQARRRMDVGFAPPLAGETEQISPTARAGEFGRGRKRTENCGCLFDDRAFPINTHGTA